jgi:hypothetical protein
VVNINNTSGNIKVNSEILLAVPEVQVLRLSTVLLTQLAAVKGPHILTMPFAVYSSPLCWLNQSKLSNVYASKLYRVVTVIFLTCSVKRTSKYAGKSRHSTKSWIFSAEGAVRKYLPKPVTLFNHCFNSGRTYGLIKITNMISETSTTPLLNQVQQDPRHASRVLLCFRCYQLHRHCNPN